MKTHDFFLHSWYEIKFLIVFAFPLITHWNEEWNDEKKDWWDRFILENGESSDEWVEVLCGTDDREGRDTTGIDLETDGEGNESEIDWSIFDLK